MLQNLHVKNLALIKEEEIEFTKGLNILSGETGAGKSIILGALHLALGDKADKGMLRSSGEEAFVEAVFSVNDPITACVLEEMGFEVIDDQVILSRKLSETKSVAKINGETVPVGKLKQVGEMLIDIYGQQDHQSLSNKKKHLQLLDEFAAADVNPIKEELGEVFSKYSKKKKELDGESIDEATKLREISFLEHEIAEISECNLKIGEDEEIEELYKKLNNNSKIMDGVSEAYSNLSGGAGAADAISRAIKRLMAVEEYDSTISSYISSLTDAEAIISDTERELNAYISGSDYDEATFNEIQSRLNEINRLKDKYGRTIEDVLKALEEKQTRLSNLLDHDEYIVKLEAEVKELEGQVRTLSKELSDVRNEYAKKLSYGVSVALQDLNFMQAHFVMDLTETDNLTSNGFNDGEFMISTNPGEPLKPLKSVASGGEMSRIMLALKTVLARNDDIDTLIFDEIDAGISGRTAQAVAFKLQEVADAHQVICITHLPQIAAFGDTNFLIEKSVVDGSTISDIKALSEDEVILELSRMLGGSTITDAVMENAKELRGNSKR